MMIAESLDPDVSINALGAIGKNTGRIEPIIEARNILESIDPSKTEISAWQISRKWLMLGFAAGNIDLDFAIDAISQTSLPGMRADGLIKLAKIHLGADEASFSREKQLEILRRADASLDKVPSGKMRGSNFILSKLASTYDLRLSVRAMKRAVLGEKLTEYLDQLIESSVENDDGIWRLADEIPEEVVIYIARKKDKRPNRMVPHLDPISIGTRVLEVFDDPGSEDYRNLLIAIREAIEKRLEYLGE